MNVMGAMRTLYKVTAAGLAGVLLSSCALGPDFERPAAPQANFSSRPLPAETASVNGPGGAAQRFLPGESVAGDWWTLFQSPALNALVAEAIANNPSLEAAEASLRQAEATYQAEADSFFPYVQGDANFNRAQSYQGFQGPGATRSPYSVATAQVSVSYSPDIFGATRRTVEGFRARRDNVAFQKEAAFLALTSNVVLTAIEDASLSAQVAATEEILSAQNLQLGVLRQQVIATVPECPEQFEGPGLVQVTEDLVDLADAAPLRIFDDGLLRADVVDADRAREIAAARLAVRVGHALHLVAAAEREGAPGRERGRAREAERSDQRSEEGHRRHGSRALAGASMGRGGRRDGQMCCVAQPRRMSTVPAGSFETVVHCLSQRMIFVGIALLS